MGWFSRAVSGFFLATVFPDHDAARVAKYLGIVHGEAIIGANIFRDLFSSVRDVVGGRAGGYERALSGARDAAVEDMISEAHDTKQDERFATLFLATGFALFAFASGFLSSH